MPKKQADGRWLVDLRPLGVSGPRLRRSFVTKREALAFERSAVDAATASRARQQSPSDARTLRQLVGAWYDAHGVTLRDGAARVRLLLAGADALGNPRASTLTAHQWAAYRADRLRAGVSPATVNRERAYWRAMFAELLRLRDWGGDNPLAVVKPIREPDTGVRYLDASELLRLLSALREGRNPDTLHVARLCLATGARWGEAESLRCSCVGADRVTFIRTKSGHSRTVPVDPALLAEWSGRRGVRLFGRCYEAFRCALDRAAISLPRGQAAHVLRHTFAAWFVQRGGSILTLQRILGHSDVRVTMVYAHLAPDHLSEALRLNPLALLAEDGQKVDDAKE